MDDDGKLRVRCPDCGSDLVIDPASGAVVFHAAPRRRAPRKDFDSLLSDLDRGKQRAAEVFDRELGALEDRGKRLEDTFREALRRAEASPEDEPPPRPWDFD